MGKMRFAIAGLGNAGRTIHLPALRKVKGAEVVGAYDVRGADPKLGLPHFSSYETMLQESRPDMVVIATPPDSHYALAQAALRSGCHVFCEKPITETLEQADALDVLAAQTGRAVVVNSEFPWMPIHLAAKARMAKPGFGALQFVRMEQTFTMTPEAEAGWRGQDSRRVLKDFGTHVLDLAMFFFDEHPCSVRCLTPRLQAPGSPDHLVLVELEFSGNRYAHILLDRVSKGRHRYLDIRLDGEDATIETSIGGRLQATLGLNVRSRSPLLDLDVAMGGQARLYRGERFERLGTAPIDLFADATARLLGEVITAVEAGRPPPCNLSAARRTMALLLACYASAEDGRPREFAA